MDRLNVVANTMRASLGRVAGWLSGCSHRKTTFPITLGTGSQAETYIACLECGRHFAYDWTAMRRARPLVVRPADARFEVRDWRT